MSSDEIDYVDFLRKNERKKCKYTPPKYTLTYRWLKSSLLVLAWISFGLNFELIGITLEDLKIYLNVNYTSVSLGPVLRNIGYLSLTIFLGLILDRIAKYSDLLMAGASAAIALSMFYIFLGLL